MNRRAYFLATVLAVSINMLCALPAFAGIFDRANDPGVTGDCTISLWPSQGWNRRAVFEKAISGMSKDDCIAKARSIADQTIGRTSKISGLIFQYDAVIGRVKLKFEVVHTSRAGISLTHQYCGELTNPDGAEIPTCNTENLRLQKLLDC